MFFCSCSLASSALESILLSVLSALEAEMVFIRNLVGGLLAEMEDNIDHDRFKRLLHYSRRLASFKNRATLVTCFAPVFETPSNPYDPRSKKRSMRSSLKVIYLIACTLQDLISSDEDMDAMYLTEKRSGINDKPHDHEELEILLESFSKQVEEIVNEAGNIEVGLHQLFHVNSDKLL